MKYGKTTSRLYANGYGHPQSKYLSRSRLVQARLSGPARVPRSPGQTGAEHRGGAGSSLSSSILGDRADTAEDTLGWDAAIRLMPSEVGPLAAGTPSFSGDLLPDHLRAHEAAHSVTTPQFKLSVSSLYDHVEL